MGGGNQAGNQGGGGQSRVGGGAATGTGTANPNPPKDDSKPSPPAQEPENLGQDNLAPQGQPQSELNFGKLHEMLKDPASAKDLEERMGMTREQIEQLGAKFKKPKSTPAGPGRDIKVKPGEQTPVSPAANLPAFDAKTRFSTKNMSKQGTMPQDDVHGNLEDVRFQPPPEYQGKWEAFKNRLSKVPAPKRTVNPSPQPATK